MNCILLLYIFITVIFKNTTENKKKLFLKTQQRTKKKDLKMICNDAIKQTKTNKQ